MKRGSTPPIGCNAGPVPDLQSDLVVFHGYCQTGRTLLENGAVDLIVMEPPYANMAVLWAIWAED